jgi:hypothetical protein
MGRVSLHYEYRKSCSYEETHGAVTISRFIAGLISSAHHWYEATAYKTSWRASCFHEVKTFSG